MSRIFDYSTYLYSWHSMFTIHISQFLLCCTSDALPNFSSSSVLENMSIFITAFRLQNGVHLGGIDELLITPNVSSLCWLACLRTEDSVTDTGGYAYTDIHPDKCRLPVGLSLLLFINLSNKIKDFEQRRMTEKEGEKENRRGKYCLLQFFK